MGGWLGGCVGVGEWEWVGGWVGVWVGVRSVYVCCVYVVSVCV
jgi:hypothetical protein